MKNLCFIINLLNASIFYNTFLRNKKKIFVPDVFFIIHPPSNKKSSHSHVRIL